jgi:hypothetical protein
MTTDDRWLKLKSACDKYDISYSALFAAVKSGEFGEDVIQSGRIWRIREAVILPWLKSKPSAS